MKFFLLFIIVIILSCHKEDANPYVDICPTCTAAIAVNGMNWPAKPNYALFQIKAPIDTLFDVGIGQTDLTHDKFPDDLTLRHIPYEVGEYTLDTLLYDSLYTDASLTVYEGGYDAPNMIYENVNDGSSVIKVKSINKTTGEFSLSFDLVIYPFGNINGPAFNTSYPVMVRMKGEVKGVVAKR